MVYAKVNEYFFGVEKLMFLIFLEHKEFVTIYFAYTIHFPYNFVTVRYFH